MNPRVYKWAVLLLPVLPVWSTSANPPVNTQQYFQGPVLSDTLKTHPKPVIEFPADTTHIFTVRKFIHPNMTDTLHTGVRNLLLTPADKKHIYTRDLLLRPQDRFRVVPVDSICHENYEEK